MGMSWYGTPSDSNLLDFSRQSTPTLRTTDINDTINRALELVDNSAQMMHIEIVKEFSPALPGIMADPDQLRQVFVNLVLNAIQAMRMRHPIPEDFSRKGMVRIEVQDTGCGISPENMQKLFTPFFTTKKEVKGVGLGLAVSYGIVQRHRGKIEVKSKEGAGTTFIIQLPEKNAREN
jgi:two-component system NtrC family sensor kinase